MADELSSRSLSLTILEAGSMIVLNVLSLVGNIVVCISVYRNKRLRTTTNLYIIALAVSDLLSAIFVMPLTSGVLVAGGWPFGENLCRVSGSCAIFVIYVSPVTMGLTAFNRYIRICKSHQLYRRVFSQRKSRLLLAAAWTLVAFYLILMTRLTGLQEFRFYPDNAVCLNAHFTKLGSIIHYFFVVGLFFALPLGVTIFSYRNVFKKIREHNMGAARAFHAQARIPGINSHEIQISRSLFVVVFAFMLCWIPPWVINLLTRFRVVANMPRNIVLLGSFCLSLSNAINPFIYAGMNPLFRKEFGRILRCESNNLAQGTSQASNGRPNTVSSGEQLAETTNNQNEEGCLRLPGRGNDNQHNEGTKLK